MDLQETKDQQVPQDQEESEESLELRVNPEPLVKPELLALKVPLEHQETLVKPELQDQLDLLDYVVQQELQVPQDHRE